MELLIAQVPDEAYPRIMIWSAALMIIVGLLFGVVWYLRRKMSVNEDMHGEGFTLGDLRRMHKEGKLSTEEFERAKAQMVGAMHAAQARTDAAREEATKRGSL